MKKVFVALILSTVCSPAFADLITPATPWQLLKPRPETSRPTIVLPEPDSADGGICDTVGSGDVSSADIRLEAAPHETAERRR